MGIAPESSLPLRESVCKDAMLPRFSGMPPVKLFKLKLSARRDESCTSWLGMLPLSPEPGSEIENAAMVGSADKDRFFLRTEEEQSSRVPFEKVHCMLAHVQSGLLALHDKSAFPPNTDFICRRIETSELTFCACDGSTHATVRMKQIVKRPCLWNLILYMHCSASAMASGGYGRELGGVNMRAAKCLACMKVMETSCSDKAESTLVSIW